MSSPDNFEAEPWPLNIESTLRMLNSEITNKSLIRLNTIVIQGEAVNVDRNWKEQGNLNKFLNLYSGLVANRETAFVNILNSPYWLPYFLVNQLNRSPLEFINTYCDVLKMLSSSKNADRKLLKYYIHIANCLMLLLKESA